MTHVDFRAARLALGMTQAQLAEALGIDPNSVARKERGEQSITARDERQIEAMLATHK